MALPSIICSNGCINLVLWIAGILIMTGLTIKDFLPILDDYRSNNVATQVSFARDSNFTPPQFVQCMPFYTKDDSLMAIARYLMNDTEECSICDKLESEGWAVWKDGNLSKFQTDGLENLYIALSLQFAKKIISEIEPGKENIFDEKFQPWNKPILKAAISFISYWVDGDFYFGDREFQGKLKDDLLEMLDKFKDSSIKLDQLLNQVQEVFCQNMRFIDFDQVDEFWGLQQANTTCQDLLINQHLPSFFNEATCLWFPLPHLSVPKRKTYHFTLMDSDVISWVSNQVSHPFIIYGDLGGMYTTILDTQPMQNIYQIERQGFGLNITIKYSVQVRAMDVRPGRNPCRDESTETCLAKCTKELMIQRCKCVPFTIKQGLTYDSNLPYCTFMTYSACNLSTEVKNDFTDGCLSKCEEAPCEFMSYNWQISHQTYDSMENSRSNKSGFNLILVPMITSFTEFKWAVKNSPEQFLSQIGGIVNFYLGFSGLSMIPFLILCVDFLRHRWLRRKKTEVQPKMESVNRMFRSAENRAFNDTHWVESIRAITADMDDFKNEIRSRIVALENEKSETKSRKRRSKAVFKQRF